MPDDSLWLTRSFLDEDHVLKRKFLGDDRQKRQDRLLYGFNEMGEKLADLVESPQSSWPILLVGAEISRLLVGAAGCRRPTSPTARRTMLQLKGGPQCRL